MKNKIFFLLAMLSCLIVGCKDEDIRYSIERPDDTMHLQVSNEYVELNQKFGKEEAVTFSWNEVTNAPLDSKVTYYFKLDIADNDFGTSIDKMRIPAGEHSVSFTHKKMNALLTKWKIEPGERVTLEAEIIAEIEETDCYVKPELSTVRFDAVGYEIQPYDIYVMGTALEGATDPANALKMTEEISEEVYTWYGVMKEGDYKFILNTTGQSPSYTQGADGSVVFNEHETGNETPFTINKAGFYVLKLNIEAGTLNADYPTTDYNDVWMVGEATPAGWNIMSSTKLTKDPVNQVAFYYEGLLKTGDMKFPLELKEDWNVAWLMPIENGTHEFGDNRMERIEAGIQGHDYKWNITKEGNYRVTLNMYTMTIDFKLVQSIPDDLPCKEIWMLGDATPAGWEQGKEAFVYDFNVDKGTFYWEGELKAGSFKCPINVDGSWAITCYMPKQAGEDGKASLNMTDVQLVQPNGNDYQWKVEESEAGQYRVELNVLTNKIKFEKKN